MDSDIDTRIAELTMIINPLPISPHPKRLPQFGTRSPKPSQPKNTARELPG
ncbi:MAG: hypothetical protein RLP02_14865 [Coleofasciculus sp. C2-GNP5-27]